MGFLYHDVQCPAQNVELLAMQSEGFTIDHNVNGFVQIEIDLLHPSPLGQRMVDVRSVIERGQSSAPTRRVRSAPSARIR